MRKVGAIVGPPGAGKSEFCRLARDEYGCAVLSFDDLAAMPTSRSGADRMRRDPAGRMTEAALADRLQRACTQLATDRITILDSFPKGRRQAELVSALIDVSFVVVVRANEARCRARAMRRSPERFTAANTTRKFAERRRQTLEVEAVARARGIAIYQLRNDGDLEGFRATSAQLLTTLHADKDHRHDVQ